MIRKEVPAPAPAEEPGPATTDPPPEEKPPEVPKPSFPKALSRGGPVIANPKVRPIVFAGDPLASQIDSFTQKIAVSSYWKNVGAEYGVGAITPLAPIVISEQPPSNLTSTDIDTWLMTKLSGASPELGVPDSDTLYAIYYPSGVSITLEGGGEFGQSCQGYGGYHYETAIGATKVGYAVMPRCAGIDQLTVTASHEYFEWATDPFPLSKPAYNRLDDEHWAWQAAMIGELSDLCTFLDREDIRPTDVGFLVQRHWSNKLSLAGQFPCAPVKDVAYTQLIAFPTEEALVPDYGGAGPNKYIATKSFNVEKGKSRSVDVFMYADKPVSSPVEIRAISYNEWYHSSQPSGFDYRLDRQVAKVGDKVKLTIEAPSAASYDLLVLIAFQGMENMHMWPVLVTNDDGSGIKEGRPTITHEMLPKKPEADIWQRVTTRVRFTTAGWLKDTTLSR